MYARVVGVSTTGAGGAALASTGGFHTLAIIVGATTLLVLGATVLKLVPRHKNR